MVGNRQSRRRLPMLALALLALVLVQLASPASSRASEVTTGGGTEIIDDTDSRFSFSQGGANGGGWDFGGSGSPSATEHWANRPAGATLDVSFTGTGIELFGKKAPNHGMFAWWLDDAPEPAETDDAHIVDAYAGTAAPSSLLVRADGLTRGEHVLHIKSIARKNEASTAGEDMFPIQVEYARVLGVEIDMGAEVVTEIDDANTTSTGESLKFQFDANGWTPESGYPDLFQNGTDTYSLTPGASWTIRFNGSKIDVFGSRAPGHGTYSVTLDGEPQADIFATEASRLDRQLLGSYGNLDPNAEHTLTVALKTGAAIQVDYAEVTHKPIAATGISVLPSSLTLESGGAASLAPSIAPSAAVNPGVVLSFDDELLSIDAEGAVTAKDVTERTETTVTVSLASDRDTKVEVPVVIMPRVEGFNAFVADPGILDIPAEAYDAARTTFTDTWTDTVWLGDKRVSKIGVATRDAAVENVRIEASDFTSEDGSTITSANVEAAWLRTVDAREYRGAGGSVKAYPDIIYHANTGHDIPAESLALAWVTVSVPADAKAGTYTGTLTVTGDGVKAPVKLTYILEVIGLAQPTADEVGYEVQLWQHPFSVSGYYFANSTADAARATGANADIATFMSDGHKDLMRGSLREYASIGGHDLVANIVEEAWNHQSYYGDTSMVTWIKRADGSWGFDYARYDAWLSFAEECGVIDPAAGVGKIKCYSMVSWGGFRYLDEATGEIRALPASVTQGSAAWRAMWEAFLKDFHAHSEELGTWDITYISMDERDYSQLRPVVDLVGDVERAEGFDIKLSSALNVDADASIISLSDDIEDISMNIMNINHEAEFRELADARAAKGLTTTIYNCTGGYPNNFMRNDPGDNYWTMWYALSTHTDGYLRWAWDNWVNDMFGDVTYRYWEPGDGWFIYPLESASDLAKNPAGFYSTPRYEMLKQGIRDVCKALYLKRSFPDVSDRIDRLIDSLERGGATMLSGGTAAPANEAARQLTHSESARVYEGLTAIAREVAPAPEPAASIGGAVLTAADGAKGTPVERLVLASAGGEVAVSVDGVNLADGDVVTAQVFTGGDAVGATWAKVVLTRGAARGVAVRAAAPDGTAAYTGAIGFPANGTGEAVAYEVRFFLNGEEVPAERVGVEVAAAGPGEQPGTGGSGTEDPGAGQPGNNGGAGDGGDGKSAVGGAAKGPKPTKGVGGAVSPLPKTGDDATLLGIAATAGGAIAVSGAWIRRCKRRSR